MVSVWDAMEDLNSLIVEMRSMISTASLICTINPTVDGLGSCEFAFSPGTHFLELSNYPRELSDSGSAYFSVQSLDDIDNDGDGFSYNQGDCDDTDPSISPTQPEVENGFDDDCDTLIDEGTNAFDDDGDCYCEDAPCTGSTNPIVPLSKVMIVMMEMMLSLRMLQRSAEMGLITIVMVPK